MKTAFYKVAGGVGAFVVGFALSASLALAQVATTSTNTGADYTEGTYYYYYNAETGVSQSSANPSVTSGAEPSTSLNVNGQSSNPNQNSYLYYYSTAGASPANQPANTTGINQGVADVTTPGLPNTGAGGDAGQIILALVLSGLAFTVGGVALSKAA